MGRTFHRRLIYSIVCFLTAACVIYLNPSNDSYSAKEPLNLVFSEVDGWKPINAIGMQDEVVDSLSLDDYLFRSYKKDEKRVTLYVGYYRTADKIGAAHSPLVCFPGQGWSISTPQKIPIRSEAGMVNSEKITAAKDGQKELLIYWFQSYDMTSGGTFMQKMNGLWIRMKGNPADNAFVRVSVPVKDNNIDEAEHIAKVFIKDYYPLFLAYIKN